MKPINVAYSTDYELFLGANFASPSQVLVAPTELLLRRCESVNVPLTLFVDVLSIFRHRELGKGGLVDVVEDQLRDAVRRGHDVQAHIHPHWLQATQRGDYWDFPRASFLLGTHVAPAEVLATSTALLRQVKSYLEELLRPVDPAYECLAYRAGGYGLQPRAELIMQALLDAGYMVDSSIVPGMLLRTEFNAIDFRKVPASANYFLDGQGIEQVARRGIFEVPILAGTMSPVGFARRFLSYLKTRGARPEWTTRGRGTLQLAASSGYRRARDLAESAFRKARIVAKRWAVLELSDDPTALMALTESYLESHAQRPLFFSFSSHSKILTPALLDALGQYHRALDQAYPDQVAPVTFREIATHCSKG